MTTEQLVADVLELAAIPAPTFAEEARLDWLERAPHLGAGTVGPATRPGNLVWQWGDGRPELAILAHVDTVFPAETPLSFRREDGRLIGPGIGDNAAAVVVALHAVSEFLGEQPARPGALVFTVGEEGLGNLSGAPSRLARASSPPRSWPLRGTGSSACSSMRSGALASGFASRGRAAIPGSTAAGRARCTGSSPSARICSRTRTPDTPVNLGTISGGQSVNTIAAEAELVAEMRSLDEAPLDAFVAAAESLRGPRAPRRDRRRRRAAARRAARPGLAAPGRRPSVRRDLGLPDELEAGSTDANAALARGIPAVALGCSYGQGMHTTGEWIEADALKLGLRQLAGVLERVLAA